MKPHCADGLPVAGARVDVVVVAAGLYVPVVTAERSVGISEVSYEPNSPAASCQISVIVNDIIIYIYNILINQL